MKKLISALSIIIAITIGLSAEKVASFPDLSRPAFMSLDNEQMYVTEGPTVFIYSLKDYSLKHKFGQAGDGPREFRIGQGGPGMIMVMPQKDHLLISSAGKVSFFTKSGEYIKEMKTLDRTMPGMFQPIGGIYVGMGTTMGSEQAFDLTVNTYNSQFEKQKTIHSQPFMRRGSMDFPMVSPMFMVADDLIYLVGEKGFTLNAYNLEGEMKRTISREYKKIRVHKRYKDGVHEFFKTSPSTAQAYEFIKNMIKFTEFFPAIQFFEIDGDLIFIQTYKQKGDLWEFFIYDIRGKFIKSMYLPLAFINGFMPSPYTFKGGKLHQLVDNEDEEMWELHITEVKLN